MASTSPQPESSPLSQYQQDDIAMGVVVSKVKAIMPGFPLMSLGQPEQPEKGHNSEESQQLGKGKGPDAAKKSDQYDGPNEDDKAGKAKSSRKRKGLAKGKSPRKDKLTSDGESEGSRKRMSLKTRLSDSITGMTKLNLFKWTPLPDVGPAAPAQQAELCEEARLLKLVHPLSVMDQSVSRKYTRRMLIFDFPELTDETIARATACLRQGLEVAFKKYPFLTGKLGPAKDTEQGLMQLRYGDKPRLRAVTDDIFKFRKREKTAFDESYHRLCAKGMPVSHMLANEYCATSPPLTRLGTPAEEVFNQKKWYPVFKLQANFLSEGGLILCFAFQQPVVDNASISLFLGSFAEGVRGDVQSDNVGEAYVPTDLGILDKPGHTQDHPEWDFSRSRKKRPPTTAGIFTVPNSVVVKWQEGIIEWLKNNPEENDVSGSEPLVATMDCIAARMWVAMQRARHQRTFNEGRRDEKSMFVAPVDLRSKLPTPPPNYFGNLFTTAFAARAFHLSVPVDVEGRLEETDLNSYAQVALRIRQGLDAIDGNYIASRLGVLRERPNEISQASDMAVKSDLYGFRFDAWDNKTAELDFGIPGTTEDGRPRFIRTPWEKVPGSALVLPRRAGDSDWEILVCTTLSEMRKMEDDMRKWGATLYANDQHWEECWIKQVRYRYKDMWPDRGLY